MDSIQPVVASVTVDGAPAAAFDRFTAGFGSWWPAEFSWSRPALLESIGMDCREGGLLTETGPHGFRVDWGRIVTWERHGDGSAASRDDFTGAWPMALERYAAAAAAG